jgi:hypothetical protein
MLTVNPGWDGGARALSSFTDVHELQRQLKAQGASNLATLACASRSRLGAGRAPIEASDGARAAQVESLRSMN